MSQLIQIRQRIKSIETIKKITHAMRLISMSGHSHLRQQYALIKSYSEALRRLYLQLAMSLPNNNRISQLSGNSRSNTILCIVVSSQKGLVGNFNNALFNYFSQFTKEHTETTLHTIGVGKQIVDHLTSRPYLVKQTFHDFSIRTLSSIAQDIATYIFSHLNSYQRIVIVSNQPKTFFLQQPIAHTIIPFAQPSGTITESVEYRWHQPPETIIESISKQLIYGECYTTLFESLLAEQAARFLSMDSSTRNAEQLLDETKLMYNKLRQAKITKEISEVTGSI